MLTLVVVGLAASGVGHGPVGAQEPEQPRFEVVAEDDNGRVWAVLSLTGQRVDEAYLPIVVGVQNNAKKPVTLNRDSFRLRDLDGIIYLMPSVRDWRKNYDKIVLDRRMMSTGGIPWRVWYTSRKLGPTNFFPDLQTGRGNILRDSVTLRRGHGMMDLLYFERPRNLSAGRPFFLEVWGKNWESPIRLRLLLS
jgi:hypothetical protein